ncbi:MAG: hypothetical protein IJD01_00130 [Clostridia bacterium]|nr:hypothetical protein [Clostridia bacterium]
MNERQYVMQHILHLSAMLKSAESEAHRRNIEEALLFYARELQRIDSRKPPSMKQ